MKRRHLILMLGGTSSGALSVGTGAFSSARMERGVNVSVADDENAFVRYETPSDEAVIEQGGERITLVRIRNQFGGNQRIALVGVDIDADPDVLSEIKAERKLTNGDDPADPEDVEPPDEGAFDPIHDVTIVRGSDADDFPDPDEGEAFGPGGWARVVADANPYPGQEVDIEVTITVKGIEGTGVSARIFGDTRTFTIEGKTPDEIEGLTFNGARNANADGASGDYTLDLWFVDKDDSELDEYIIQERNWDGSGNVNSGNADENSEVKDRRLLAVRFRETDQTFYRPDCEISEEDVPWDVESFITGDENGNAGCNWD